MKDARKPLISIVIPAFNEERRLPVALEALAEHCRRLSTPWEVIAVVECSTDQTVERSARIARREPAISVVVNQVQRGKGYALRTGIGMAMGEIIFTMDVDLSVPLEFVDSFLERMLQDPAVDILIGSRRHPDAEIAVRQSRSREFFGNIFSRFVRWSTGSAFHDTQCGFKAMRRRPALEVYSRLTIDGFACDVELLLLAQRLGFEIVELPVRWANSQETRVRILRDGWRMFWDVLLVRWRVGRTLARVPLRESR